MGPLLMGSGKIKGCHVKAAKHVKAADLSREATPEAALQFLAHSPFFQCGDCITPETVVAQTTATTKAITQSAAQGGK